MDKYLGSVLDNRYEMLDIIGTGGMAVVYRARDIKLNRLVAIKILKEEFINDEDLRHRFHTESEAVAALNHQNIVKIFDMSNSENEEYIVMELVDGITLKQYMKQRGILSVKETLHFMTQILRALDHAHTMNIIHRDIKPQNIMILRDTTVKVTDFGIARIASKQNTVSQSAFGSVHYISPEQAKGEDTDGRSDIYSVGVMMYEMLTSKLPYEGDTPVSIALQHIQSTPKPPSFYNPDLPGSIENVILRAMCADLYYRYSTAQQMLNDLEEIKRNPEAVIIFDGAEAEQSPTRKMDIITKNKTEELRPINKKQSDKTKKTTNLPLLIGALVSLVFLITALIVVINLVNSNVIGGDVPAPNLLNMQYNDAVELLKNDSRYKTLTLTKDVEKNDKDHPAGEIVAQNPQPDIQIKRNSTIKLTVSLGAKSMILPAMLLDGMTKEQVLSYLNTAFQQEGIDVNITSKTEKSDTVVKNYLIRSEPEIGSEIKDGGTLVLYFSAGIELKQVKMPNLLTLTETDAKRALLDNTLAFAFSSWESSSAAYGTVCDMRINGKSIKYGDWVTEQTEIELVLSSGEATQPPAKITSDEYVLPLPTDKVTYNVLATIDDKIYINQQYTDADTFITIVVEGEEGTKHKIKLYIDGTFFNELEVTLPMAPTTQPTTQKTTATTKKN